MSEKDWRVEAVDSGTYASLADDKVSSVYNTAKYNRINEDKTERVWYLLIYKGNSLRFSAVFGEDKGIVRNPFSAPFGYPEVIRKDAGVEDFYCAFDAMESFFIDQGVKGVDLYPAPEYFSPNIITTWQNILLNKGYRVDYSDVNYAFLDLNELVIDYEKKIFNNARKNLNVSKQNGCEFIICDSAEQYHVAYEIIKENRKIRKHPLHMKEEDLNKTIPIVGGEWFLVRSEGEYIASSLVYPVTKDIAQVIYWGDLPDYAYKRPTNFLSYELIKYFANKGYKHLDVGISTVEGIANYGLCDFKESIGCSRTSKLHYSKGVTV